MEAFALSADTPRVPLPQRLLSDERLLRLIAAGNAQAFGAVYSRYHAPLYAYCRSIVRDPDDARDALQSTMTKALAALARSSDRDLALKPWLFRIAHNESISLLRRRRPSEPLTDAVSPPVAGADRVAESRERLAQLVADLQALPERQRSALIMREVNGLSYEEVAAALGIGEGAARQTIFEARTALAEYGAGREVACENIRRSISDGDGRALRARRVRAHLRACDSCSDFHARLRDRRRDLAMLAPGLSGGTVVALLQGVLGAGVAGGGAAMGGAGLLGGSGSTLLASGAAKSVVAIVAATAAGAGAVEIRDGGRHVAPAAVHAAPAAAAPHAPPGPAQARAASMIRSGGTAPATRPLAPLARPVHLLGRRAGARSPAPRVRRHRPSAALADSAPTFARADTRPLREDRGGAGDRLRPTDRDGDGLRPAADRPRPASDGDATGPGMPPAYEVQPPREPQPWRARRERPAYEASAPPPADLAAAPVPAPEPAPAPTPPTP